MLRPLFLSLMLTAVAAPAMAQDVKQEIDKVRLAYETCVGKHDAACVAALYTKDGVQINPGGVFSDLKKTYEDNFKSGNDSVKITANNVWPINNDLALAEGTADISRTTEPPMVKVFWTGVYVREAGQMKIRLLTVGMRPLPKEADAAK
jgi:ketosteroid isomerase-like protein